MKIIQKVDARKYENALKKELKSWADEGHLTKVSIFLKYVSTPISSKVEGFKR